MSTLCMKKIKSITSEQTKEQGDVELVRIRGVTTGGGQEIDHPRLLNKLAKYLM